MQKQKKKDLASRRALLVLLSAVLASACAPGVALPRESLTQPAALLFNGYTQANVQCFICHNGDGRGARGPDLSPSVPKMSEQAIVKIIREGAPGMPRFSEKLSAEQTRALAEWLKATFPAR